MFRRGFFFRALGAFLFLTLLVVGGYAIHRAGVAQGYALGLATAGSLPEGTAASLAPYLYARPYGYGPGFHPFGGFGFIFPLFFGTLFFFLFMRLIFRPWGWGGPHAYWKHYGSPPWAKDWEKGEPKTDEKPDVKSESE